MREHGSGLSGEDNQKAKDIYAEKLAAESDIQKATTDLVMSEKNREYSQQILDATNSDKKVTSDWRTGSHYDERTANAAEDLHKAWNNSEQASVDGKAHFESNVSGYIEQANIDAADDGVNIKSE